MNKFRCQELLEWRRFVFAHVSPSISVTALNKNIINFLHSNVSAIYFYEVIMTKTDAAFVLRFNCRHVCEVRREIESAARPTRGFNLLLMRRKKLINQRIGEVSWNITSDPNKGGKSRFDYEAWNWTPRTFFREFFRALILNRKKTWDLIFNPLTFSKPQKLIECVKRNWLRFPRDFQ